MTVVCCWPG